MRTWSKSFVVWCYLGARYHWPDSGFMLPESAYGAFQVARRAIQLAQREIRENQVAHYIASGGMPWAMP